MNKEKIAIIQCSINGEELRQYNSAREAELNDFKRMNVLLCCRGRMKSHGGFKWKFKEKIPSAERPLV